MTFFIFSYLDVFLLFVVHNCRNEAINITKSDFYIHFLICNSKFCINYQAIKVTKSDFFDFWIILLLVDHNCRNYAINITNRDVFGIFFFFRKNYLLLSCATSVRPSVRLSVRLSSVEIISFRGNSLSNRPINLKIGLNVREGVVHVRKMWFFEILIASCKSMQFANICK